MQLLGVLYAQFARHDVDAPTRQRRERKIERTRMARELVEYVAQPEERKKLVESIRGWCNRYQQIADVRKLRQSGVQKFSGILSAALSSLGETGLSVDTVRRALGGGATSVRLFAAYREFERQEKVRRAIDAEEREKMEELIELARVPKEIVVGHETRTQNGRRRRVPIIRHEPVVANVGESGAFGDATEGYRWEKKVELFLLPRVDPSGRDGWAVVEAMATFARSAPGLLPRAKYPEWMVYALCSELVEESKPLHEGSKRTFRPDLDHEDARRFIVNEAYSSGLCRGKDERELRRCKGRDKAVDRFIVHIGKGIDSPNVIFVHGVIAWNFRRRSVGELAVIEEAKEAQNIIDRVRRRPASPTTSSPRPRPRRRKKTR